MKKITTFFLFLLLVHGSLHSAEVSLQSAQKAGLNFMNQRSRLSGSVNQTDLSVRESVVKSDDDVILYYIFNLDPQGWIIIPADDAIPPVLAYSFEGSYSIDGAPEQCSAWMKQYEDQIRYARENNLTGYSYVPDLWNEIFDPRSSSFVIRNSRSVAPLITSNWNQNSPYNAACPADPAGPGGHAWAGCVPVCMGQVMYYFRWPETGTGSYSYYDSTYGTLSANFDTTHYYWNRMTDVATGDNPAIAQLLFHLGVSCDLVYGPGGSGMYNHKAAYSLRTYFKYSPQTQYVYRDSTTMDWDSLLISHLDRRIPMYYAGWSVPNIDGHAFVCDGYQDSCYFHFNFGWSGQNNGYFYTSDLTPGGYNFNLAQEVIINCYPDTAHYTYPEYCTGGAVLNYTEGTFGDGSGPVQLYQPNASCSWLIEPQTETDSITSISLQFKRFETNPGDIVNIYDGGTTESPLLASISGDTLPSSITSTGNKMLVTFQSSMGPPSEGFFAGYTTEVPVWCSGTTEIEADTLELTDGSSGFDYHNGQICRWKVTKPSGGPLTLNFRSFRTEEERDVLKIYDFTSSELIATISGHYPPDTLPAPVTIESGVAFLTFTTNSSVTDQGWEMYYPKSTQGVEEKGAVSMKVFPNPADEKVTVSITSAGNQTGILRIVAPTGHILKEIRKTISAGRNQTDLDVSVLLPGIYFLQYSGESGQATVKIVVF